MTFRDTDRPAWDEIAAGEAGCRMRMPGLPRKPAYLNMDVDANGEVVGLS